MHLNKRFAKLRHVRWAQSAESTAVPIVFAEAQVKTIRCNPEQRKSVDVRDKKKLLWISKQFLNFRLNVLKYCLQH